ncbi:MAG: hypothetical protein U0987_00140 [Afipia sp.]|nr:hypothetical protein [Afipia sp.]
MLFKRADIQIHAETDGEAAAPRGTFLLFTALHILCCGVPLLLLSGISLAFLVSLWPVASTILAVVGVIGFARYLRRGCATCPRNESCSFD